MLIPNNHEMVIPEVWTDLTCTEIPLLAPIYEISNWGRIYNKETGSYLPKNIYYEKDKYITVRLKLITGEHVYAQPHRLVMLRLFYIPGCENLDVNHKDGIKYHNWIWNLEWCTRKENIQHALDNNLFIIGENRKLSKITNKQAEKICELISIGKTSTEIEQIMNLENCNIKRIARNIRQGHSWKHISCNYNFPHRKINKE